VPTPPSWLRTARALVVNVEITVNMLPVALDGKVVVTALPPAHTTVPCRQTAKLLVVLSKIATSISGTQSKQVGSLPRFEFPNVQRCPKEEKVVP